MRILVTGAAGKLGNVVCRHLAAQGEEVVAVDGRYVAGLPVKLHVANLLDRTAVYALLDGCQAVVHLANHPTVWGRSPQSVYAENATTDANVFQAAMDLGVRQIVFSSSIQMVSGTRYAVDLGKPSSIAYLPGDGNLPACCGNLYAQGKHAAESLLQYYAVQAPDRSYTAIRFPMLTNNSQQVRYSDVTPYRGVLDEMFVYLATEDAAAFIYAVLKTNRPGYACCLPAAVNNSLGWPLDELIKTFYLQVPLRQPLGEIKSLVDLDVLRVNYGWEPRQKYELAFRKVEGVPER